MWTWTQIALEEPEQKRDNKKSHLQVISVAVASRMGKQLSHEQREYLLHCTEGSRRWSQDSPTEGAAVPSRWGVLGVQTKVFIRENEEDRRKTKRK